MRLAPLRPPAPVETPFWATWGSGQWGAVLTALGIIVAVAIYLYQRKDAQRAEERRQRDAQEAEERQERAEKRKERVAALRAILVELVEVEKSLKPFRTRSWTRRRSRRRPSV
jgi:hypothetical protein